MPGSWVEKKRVARMDGVEEVKKGRERMMEAALEVTTEEPREPSWREPRTTTSRQKREEGGRMMREQWEIVQ